MVVCKTILGFAFVIEDSYVKLIGGHIQGLKSIGSMRALLPGRVPLARKVDQN
jgi:hypothetical protein